MTATRGSPKIEEEEKGKALPGRLITDMPRKINGKPFSRIFFLHGHATAKGEAPKRRLGLQNYYMQQTGVRSRGRSLRNGKL